GRGGRAARLLFLGGQLLTYLLVVFGFTLGVQQQSFRLLYLFNEAIHGRVVSLAPLLLHLGARFGGGLLDLGGVALQQRNSQQMVMRLRPLAAQIQPLAVIVDGGRHGISSDRWDALWGAATGQRGSVR